MSDNSVPYRRNYRRSLSSIIKKRDMFGIHHKLKLKDEFGAYTDEF